MSAVLFLGAGASADAGYPLASQLLERIESHVAQSPFQDEKRDWQRFTRFGNSASGALSMVLRCTNPEVVLTVPDLLEAGLSTSDSDHWKRVKTALRDGDEENLDSLQQYWSDPGRNELVQAVLAKEAFQRLADCFFSHQHCSDSLPAAKVRRCYLDRALSTLTEDDIVITTNWDTLAERVLLEQGKWYPTDGYGFRVRVLSGPEWGPQEELRETTKIKVLKLHGSIGWFRTEHSSRELYLRHDNYLQYFSTPEHPTIRDASCPPSGHGPDVNPVVAFPSYLKQLEDEKLQAIWDQAASALYSSDRIEFVGYSLPAADVAIRALLNPLRRRLADGACSVTAVVARDARSEQRWREFLGPDVDVVKKTAREYFC